MENYIFLESVKKIEIFDREIFLARFKSPFSKSIFYLQNWTPEMTGSDVIRFLVKWTWNRAKKISRSQISIFFTDPKKI